MLLLDKAKTTSEVHGTIEQVCKATVAVLQNCKEMWMLPLLRHTSFLCEYHLQNRVELQAFDWRVLKLVHHLDSSIHTAALLSSDTVSFDRIDSPLDGVWTAGLRPQDFDWNYPKMAAILGVTCFEPCEMEVTPTMIEQAHDLGMKVVTWHWAEKQGVWSDWKRSNQLLNWGVEGLIVDDLANVEAILAQRHQADLEGHQHLKC